MLNGMAHTFECVNKIIIGSGGGYRVTQQGGGFQKYGSEKFLLSAKSYELSTDDCCCQ